MPSDVLSLSRRVTCLANLRSLAHGMYQYAGDFRVRLPNGNTLVTTMARGAVEFDRNGQEVWTYRSTTRVTRALRTMSSIGVAA